MIATERLHDAIAQLDQMRDEGIFRTADCCSSVIGDSKKRMF